MRWTRCGAGYEPGGFNLGAFAPSIPTVKSETPTDYELGAKKTWGSTLLLDGSAFCYRRACVRG